MTSYKSAKGQALTEFVVVSMLAVAAIYAFTKVQKDNVSSEGAATLGSALSSVNQKLLRSFPLLQLER